MQFSFVLVLLTALSVVSAYPSGQVYIRSTCSVGKCLAALGPGAVSCSTAALELGKNKQKDAACLATAVNNVANVPAACQGCVDAIKNKAPVKKVDNALHKAENAVKNVAHKAGEKIKQVFTGHK